MGNMRHIVLIVLLVWHFGQIWAAVCFKLNPMVQCEQVKHGPNCEIQKFANEIEENKAIISLRTETIAVYKQIKFKFSFTESGELNLRFRNVETANCTFVTVQINHTRSSIVSAKWWTSSSVARTYFLQYNFNNTNGQVRYRNFLFYIPKEQPYRYRDNRQLFMYIIPNFDLNYVVLCIETKQDVTLIYQVRLYEKYCLPPSDYVGDDKLVNDTVLENKEALEEIRVLYTTIFKQDNCYYFTVVPIRTNRSTKVLIVSKSALIDARLWRKGNNYNYELRLFVCIVSVWIIIPVTVYCLLLRIKLYVKKNQRRKSKVEILLVYPSHNAFHNMVVHELHKFLTNSLKMVVLLDVKHLMPGMNPIYWYREAVTSCDCVLAIPLINDRAQIALDTESIYTNLDKVVFQLINNMHFNKKLVALMLPYCDTQKGLPPKMLAFKQFQFANELQDFLKCITNYRICAKFREDLHHLESIVKYATANITNHLNQLKGDLDLKDENCELSESVILTARKLDLEFENISEIFRKMKEISTEQSGIDIRKSLDEDDTPLLVKYEDEQFPKQANTFLLQNMSNL